MSGHNGDDTKGQVVAFGRAMIDKVKVLLLRWRISVITQGWLSRSVSSVQDIEDVMS